MDEVDRAVEVAGIFLAAGFESKTEITTRRNSKTEASILVYAHTGPSTSAENHAALIDIGLSLAPRIRRVSKNDGDVWGEFIVDGIKVLLTAIGRCRRIETTKQVPEMVESGAFVEETVVSWECSEGEVT